MKNILAAFTLIFTTSFMLAQNVGINQNNPQNSLHITPITIGDNPLRIDNIQAYTVGDTSILVINPTSGVVKYMNATELSSSILNTTVINNITDSLLSNTTFINNFGDSLFLSQTFVDSLISNIYNHGDTLLYNTTFINNLGDTLLSNNTFITNLGDTLLGNTTFVSNFGDSLFLSQNFIDSLTANIYNNGDTLLYNETFISSLRDSIDTDVDSITLTGTILHVYENGNDRTVDLSSLSDNDADPTNEIQTISETGNTITLSNGGGTVTDTDTQLSEAQVDAFANNNGYLTSFTEVDGSVTNELQTISRTGSNIALSNGGGNVSINDADSSPTNENNISISLSGNTLSIVDNGGTINVDLSPLVNNAIANAVPAGTVNAYAGASAPTGYLVADGSAISRTTYPNLFTAIGVMYGNGNGSTTFNLPNYNGQFLRGVDNGQGTDLDAASRTNRGDGTTGDAVGTKQTNQTLAHNHAVNPPNTNTNTTGNHLHTVNPPNTNTNTTGNHLHTVNPPNTNTSTTGNHRHSVDPPNTNTSTNGNHRHLMRFNQQQDDSGSGGAANDMTVAGSGYNKWSDYAGNHRHSVNIPAFNSAYSGNHRHSVDIAQFNSNTTGNHAHSVDIAQFNSNTTGNHAHSVDIANFNSANAGGTETRPTNISVLWCIKF